jgi:RNA polymerase sigma factor (sigma-70 family)
LREHNTAHSVGARLRLRMALHAGEVTHDEHGATSTALNLAFRLLDAAPLKHALADSPASLALITSDWFYDEVVRDSTGDAGSYRPVQVTAKETTTTAWIRLPEAENAGPTPEGSGVAALLDTAVQGLTNPDPAARVAALSELAWPGEAAVDARAFLATEGRHSAAHDADFAAFYKRHARPLMGFLIVQGANPSDAADVAQDTMVAAYRRWHSVHHPRAWIYRMAAQTWARRAAATHEIPTAEPRRYSGPPAPLTDIEQWEQLSDVAAVLARLPPPQRQVMAWTLVGYKPLDVASELGISPERARSHLKQARRALRSLLARSVETRDATAPQDVE